MQLALANESKRVAEEEVRVIYAHKEVTETRLVNVEAEKGALLVTVLRFLEGEVEKERSLSAEALVRCQMLEDELSRTKIEAENKEKALLAENLVTCQHLEEELRKTKYEAEMNRATSAVAKVDQERFVEIDEASFYGWSSHPTSMPLLALPEDDDDDDENEGVQTPSPISQGQGNATMRMRSFKSPSCFCLTDLQEEDDEDEDE